MTAASTEHARPGHELLPHVEGVYRAALVLAGNATAAEGLVLDTFGTAFAALDRAAPATDVTAWLYRILLATFTTRRGPRQPEPTQPATAHVRGRPRALRIAPTELSGAADVERLPKRRFAAALQALTVESRIVIYLVDVEGFTYDEIAQITGIPAAEVPPRVRRARTRLRELLAARVA